MTLSCISTFYLVLYSQAPSAMHIVSLLALNSWTTSLQFAPERSSSKSPTPCFFSSRKYITTLLGTSLNPTTYLGTTVNSEIWEMLH